MPAKTFEPSSEKKNYSSGISFPLSQSPTSSLKRRYGVEVKSERELPAKIFHYFKVDSKTGIPFKKEKQLFLAQVLCHELEEGIRILERLGRKEQVQLLQSPSPKMHLENQIQLLREWFKQNPLRDLPPERVFSALKLRNNQNGSASAIFNTGQVAGFTSHGLFYKDQNQDALLMVPERSVLAVLDGMGGHVAGHIASGVLTDFLEYALKHGLPLEKAIEFANEAVIQRRRNDSSLGGMYPMGTTLVCAEIKNNELHSVHMGDSKLLLIRQKKIIHETQDHTQGQDLLREGLVDLETAHSLNHLLSRCLGTDSILSNRDLSCSRIPLKKGDRVLLASDGITDNFFSRDFSLTELAEVASLASLEESVQQVQNLCVERIRKGSFAEGRSSKPDNLTLLLYEHRQ